MRQAFETLERFAHHHFAVADKKLRRAMFGAANHRQQSINLFARDQTQHATGGTRQDSPIWTFLLAKLAGILEHKDGTRLHLLRNPLVEEFQFTDHVFLPVSSFEPGRDFLKSFSSTLAAVGRRYRSIRVRFPGREPECTEFCAKGLRHSRHGGCGSSKENIEV